MSIGDAVRVGRDRGREGTRQRTAGRERARSVTLRAGAALGMLLSWATLVSSPLCAQVRPRDPRPPLSSPWSSILTEAARLVVTPSFDAVEVGSSRAGLDAAIHWEHSLARDRVARLGLDLGAAWRADGVYRRTGVAAAYGVEKDRVAAHLQLAAGVGSGDGPGTVFSGAVTGRAGVLRLDVRTSLLRDEPVRVDSVPRPGGGFSPISGTESLHYTDAELSAHRRLGPLRTSAVIGGRFGEDRGGQDRWASAQVIAPLRGRLGLQLAGGWQPERRDLAQPAGAFARIALQLEVRAESAAHAPPAPNVPASLGIARLPSGGYRFSLACTPGTVVELKGDLTDWEPLPLRAAAPSSGLCSRVITAEPGVYHVVMRIDRGPWSVPPGLTPVPDGFGGLAGLLSLPSS